MTISKIKFVIFGSNKKWKMIIEKIHGVRYSIIPIINKYYDDKITFASSSLPKAFNKLPKSLRTQYKSWKKKKLLFLQQR